MAIHAPQKEAFDIATKRHSQLTWVEIGASLLSMLFTGLAFCSFYVYISGYVNVLSIILLLLSLCLKIRFRLSYRDAEAIRRDSLIDNSFGTKLAETEAVEYYENANMRPGFSKLLSSIHESSILSLAVINRMLKKQELINLFLGIFLIIACTICSLQSELFLALFSGVMSINFIGDFIELCFLKSKIRTVIDNCKNICENHLNTVEDSLTPSAQARIIRECLRYENALSYAAIMFDEDIYNKLNKTHNEKWEAIQKRYYQ